MFRSFLCACLLLMGGLQPLTSRTIAISYFDNTSGNVKFNALSKGIADMLITDLSKVPGITIVERERLEALLQEIKLGQSKYFDQKTAQKLGKGLGAQAILTGAFFIMDNTIRIDARLIDVESGGVIAAEEVTGSKSNFFTLHKQLVSLLVKGLKVSYNPDKSEYFKSTDKVAFATVVSYSNAIAYQDQGLTADARKMLESTLNEQPNFLFAKSKLEELKEWLKKVEEQREKQMEEELKNLISNLHVDNAQFGQQLNQVWTNLMTSYHYSKLLAVNERLRKNEIDPASKMYGEASPITFGEMASYYDCLAYSQLKRYDELLDAGKFFLANHPTSMYFSSVKMSMDQAIKELEDRDKGSETVKSALPVAQLETTLSVLGKLDRRDYLKYMTTKDYKKYKTIYTTEVLNAPKELIMAIDDWDKFGEITEFFAVAKYFDDIDLMKQIATRSIELFAGSDAEEKAYRLEETIEDHQEKSVKTQAEIKKVQDELKEPDDELLVKRISRLYAVQKFGHPELTASVCETFLKSKASKNEENLDTRRKAWKGLLVALTDMGKFDKCENELETFDADKLLSGADGDQHNKDVREMRSNLRAARKEHKDYIDNVSNFDPTQKILQAFAKVYSENHQYAKEVNTRKQLLDRYNLPDEESALQFYMLAMAYYNLGYGEKATEVALTLKRKHPNSYYIDSLDTFTKFIPK